MIRRLGAVADDLTGASETAAQFARRGWVPLLELRPGMSAVVTENVLVIATDARALGPAARATTEHAVAHLVDSGIEQLFLKVDSTLRGSVAEQVDGALDAWAGLHPGAFAVVCPAYPRMHRVVADGIALAGGQRLEDGPAGRDPVTPVRTSVLAELFPGSVHVPLAAQGDAGTLSTALARAGSRARVVTVDARDDADLQRVAEAVTRLGPQAVPAGSAGLAGALADRWSTGLGSPAVEPLAGQGTGQLVVVLVTSLHQIARLQEQRLREAHPDRLLVLAPAIDVLLDPERLAAWWAAHVPTVAPQGPVVITAPAERSPQRGLAGVVVRRLADLVAELHAVHPARAVVVTGGDGARALADRWGCTGIAVHGVVREGIPFGVLVGGEVDGLPIVTKAGGFGGPDALVVAVQHAAVRRGP
jgi:D-threonate/D-erythronate kinase